MTDESAMPAPKNALLFRLAIGLAQGLALYGLAEWHARIDAVTVGSLTLIAWLAPTVALGAYGAARRRTLLIWVGAATLIAAVLGGYDGYVRNGQDLLWVTPPMAFFAAAALFILHHLILPAEAEGRWRASYERYFDDGWKDAVRLVLAGVFVGALWGLLYLGAALFKVIGLDFLERLIRENWFSYPTTSTFFAIAVHVTDVRAGLVRGARTLLLTLLSWLLPILTVIAAGFLAALPFTGLKVLWATHAASGTMLGACAALIILINATYQDGERDGFPPRVLRLFGRAAGLLLAPLVVMAGYGVALRIGQHGLTPSRIHAAACVIVAACYAAGYAWAAVARGGWMKPLELANWVTAQVVVATILVLFSPIGDPARFSVQSQVARLESGRVKPAAFDFGFLHFRSGRWGREALDRLAKAKGASAGVAAMAAAEQRNLFNTFTPPPAAAPVDRAKAIQAIGGPLPPDFLTQAWPSNEDPALGCPAQPKARCPAITADIDAAPGPEVMVFEGYRRRVYGQRGGHWAEIGELQGMICGDEADDIAHGRYRVTPPKARADLEVGGNRLAFVDRVRCPGEPNGGGEVTDVTLVKPVPPPLHEAYVPDTPPPMARAGKMAR